jgi:hypothetical protein
MFTGNTLQILKYNVVAILSFGLAASIGLMGRNWHALFFSSLVVMLPVILLVTLVLAMMNRFSFDDEQQAFLKPGGRRIPYSRVKSVHVAERGSGMDVFVKQGWMHMTSLVEAVPAGRTQQLLEELRKRFPEKMHTQHGWRSGLPILAILGILLLSLVVGHVLLYQRYPGLNAPLRVLERIEPGKEKTLPPLEFIEEFAFTPPPGYRYIGEESGELYFEDKVTKQRLKVVAGIQRRIFNEQAIFFRYAMGVANYADLMALAYHSRLGMIPLFLRAMDIDGLEQVEVFEIVPPLRGFVRQGIRDNVEETSIVILGERAGQEVHFFFSGPARVPEKILRTFVTGVQLVRPAGAP